jgi:chromate transporter
VAGAYPFWHLLRSRSWARSALAGANAAVVGILLAALYRPLCTEAIGGSRDALVVVAAIFLLAKLRVPPWALVTLMAAVGQWVLG